MAWRRIGFWPRFAVILVKPIMVVFTRRDWRGQSNIPGRGPVIIIANHISHADPLVLAHFVYEAGRWPQFLAKASIFRLPVIGYIVLGAGQIPVERGTVDAVRALSAAVQGVRDGGSVVVYPEGTITKEPGLWPMRGKTGAARLWLTTRAPVIPVVMRGPEEIFDPRTRRLRLRPHSPVTVVAGPPIDLSHWADAPTTATTLQEITDHMMLALRDMVAEVRGSTPPPLAERPSPRAGSEE